MLITGVDSGIGRTVALCCAKEGADIFVCALAEEQQDSQETMRLVHAAGRKCITVDGDFRQKSFCEQLVESTQEEFGRLDILINTATFQRTYAKLEDVPKTTLMQPAAPMLTAPSF